MAHLCFHFFMISVSTSKKSLIFYKKYIKYQLSILIFPVLRELFLSGCVAELKFLRGNFFAVLDAVNWYKGSFSGNAFFLCLKNGADLVPKQDTSLSGTLLSGNNTCRTGFKQTRIGFVWRIP